MGFRDDGEAMLARINSLERQLAEAKAVSQRAVDLEKENAVLRAELADYKARYDMPREPPPEPAVEGSTPAIAFRVREPGAQWREETLTQLVIKIGKLASSHLRLYDDTVSRMHAVIEVTHDGVFIIDLGSATGTILNGEKVNKARLESGHQLRLGGTDIIIGIAT